MNTVLICPICGEPLINEGRAFTCGSGHSYDIAASGYCNLLRPGKMRNRTSGDDREMVVSRGRFLSAGYYRPVLDRIADILQAYVPHGVLLDAGCGEGYYTNGIAGMLEDLSVIGIDASKHAVDAAAKGARRAGVAERVSYITGTIAEMPVAENAADAVLSLFAPCYYDEFARVTRPGGYLLIGSAGPSHLRELKAVLYGEGEVRPNVPIDHRGLSLSAGYTPVLDACVNYKTTVAGEHIDALFSMTPYRWRTPREGVERLSGLHEIEVAVEVDFTLLKLQ